MYSFNSIILIPYLVFLIGIFCKNEILSQLQKIHFENVNYLVVQLGNLYDNKDENAHRFALSGELLERERERKRERERERERVKERESNK